MLTAHDVFWGIIAPTGLAAVAMVLAYLFRGSHRAEPAPWGPVLAIAGGFALAYVGITGVPRHVPPRVAQDWLLLLSPAPLLIAVFATMVQRRRIGRWLVAALALILIAATATLLLKRNASAMIVPVAAAMIVWWVAMESLAARVRGATLPLLLSITSMSAAAVLMDSGVQPFAQYAGAMGFSLAAMTLISLWMRGASLGGAGGGGGGILALAVLLLGLLVCGHFFADVRARDAILLALAPLAAWAGELPHLARRPILRLAVRSVAVLVVLAIPLLPAIRGLEKTFREATESSQY